MERISSEQMYIEITNVVAKRSTCLRRHVGAVLVKEGHLISTGYNGAPRKVKSCLEHDKCLRESAGTGKKLEYCMAAHAELNAIVQAAYHGVHTEGSTLYCSFSPCSFCAKAIINAGIKEVVYLDLYADELGMRLLEEAKIITRKYAAL